MNIEILEEDVEILIRAIKDRLQAIADGYQHAYAEDLEIAGLQRVAAACGVNLGIEPIAGGRYIVVRM